MPGNAKTKSVYGQPKSVDAEMEQLKNEVKSANANTKPTDAKEQLEKLRTEMAISATKPRMLRAGNLRFTLVDGQLRYFYINDKEVIRRIYFALRDRHWNTVTPVFDTYVVNTFRKDEATVKIKAHCKDENAGVDFRFTLTITIIRSGTITIALTGVADTDFESPRIGLCVLFGADSLAGQKYTLMSKEQSRESAFPTTIGKTLTYEPDFETITFDNGAGARLHIAAHDAHFDMEDQRFFGDSSYKAYMPLTFGYPHIHAGESRHEVLAITSAVARKPVDETESPLTVTVSNDILPHKLPVIRKVPKDKAAAYNVFGDLAGNGDKLHDADVLNWGYNPFIHLNDDDTLLENATAIKHQAQSARHIAPKAALVVEPIRWERQPRVNDTLADCFIIRLVRNAAEADVRELGFATLGGGLIPELTKRAGANLLKTTTSHVNGRTPVDAFTTKDENGFTTYLCNLTTIPQTVTVIYPNGTHLKQTIPGHDIHIFNLTNGETKAKSQ